MGKPQPITFLTPAEYYEIERQAETRSEYFAGEMFAMAGGTTRHSRVKTSLLAELRRCLKGQVCEPLDGDQRLVVKATGLRCYPAAAIYCGPIEYDQEDSAKETATNPTVVFEVLSPSTEAYDRGKKAEHYRRIESLQAYVLIAQDSPHAEVFSRGADGVWRLSEASGLDATLAIPGLDLRLALRELYDRVDFSQDQPTSTNQPTP